MARADDRASGSEPTSALGCAALVVAWGFICVEPAHAQARLLDEVLEVSDASACLADGGLGRAVRVWLGRDEIDVGPTVEVDASEARATVRVLENERIVAERRFLGLPPRCEDRRAILGLAVAMALDAALRRALGIETSADGASRSETSGPTAGSTSHSTSHLLPVRVEPEPIWLFGADAGLAVGVLPDVVARIALLAGATFDQRLRVVLSVESTSPLEMRLASGFVESFVVSGRGEACLVGGEATHDVVGCATLAAGALLARGRGYHRVFDVAQPRLGLGARLEIVGWMTEALGIAAGLGAEVLLEERRFEVVDAAGAPVASTTVPQVSATFFLGARIRSSP